MDNCKKNLLKFVVGLAVVFFVRLLPFRAPNIEPILAVEMPLSKVYGPWLGALFAILSIGIFDFFTRTLGIWTLITALSYGGVGAAAGLYFKAREGNIKNYIVFAIFGTLFFDASTGLTVGPLFFSQSISQAALGQIPFTLLHLLGNISFAIFLSPAVYRYVIRNKKLESPSLIRVFRFQP